MGNTKATRHSRVARGCASASMGPPGAQAPERCRQTALFFLAACGARRSAPRRAPPPHRPALGDVYKRQVSLKAMVDGMRRVFREQPDAPVTRVVFAVPEPDRYEVARTRLNQLLVLR